MAWSSFLACAAWATDSAPRSFPIESARPTCAAAEVSAATSPAARSSNLASALAAQASRVATRALRLAMTCWWSVIRVSASRRCACEAVSTCAATARLVSDSMHPRAEKGHLQGASGHTISQWADCLRRGTSSPQPCSHGTGFCSHRPSWRLRCRRATLTPQPGCGQVVMAKGQAAPPAQEVSPQRAAPPAGSRRPTRRVAASSRSARPNPASEASSFSCAMSALRTASAAASSSMALDLVKLAAA
mmetsp:Transcript_6597/g.15131  ORF Transcript_6597/g.15131 Transcript_6597/m.15131 type:complete len:246 (-) Transcript_6597:431-1168(-)